MSRIFTEEELPELSKSLPEQALEALRAGNVEKLSHLLLQMSAAHTALHFLGVATITRIWGKWQRDHGEEKAVTMLERIGRRLMEPLIRQLAEGREKETITDILDIYKHHAGARMRRGMPCRQYVWKKGAKTRPDKLLLRQVGMSDTGTD